MTPELPDLQLGIPLEALDARGMILGRVGDEQVVVVRKGQEFFAVGALCSHYHANLAEGLVVDDTIRCPMHHACFSLRTGVALRAPAIDAIACWRVEVTGNKLMVREKQFTTRIADQKPRGKTPQSVIIVGGGAAGLAAAVALRREGYENPLTVVSADDSAPYDRPNLSKDYLAGTAPEDWMPLRPPEFYSESRINLVLNARATSLDTSQKRLTLEDGRVMNFDSLLLATGAEPVRLAIPGATADNLRYLRTFEDCRAILAKALQAKRVVILGASFIALEVAAALRARGLAVDVVGQEKIPMERVLGAALGEYVQHLHESRGVVFHLGATISGIGKQNVTLSNGTQLDADFVVAGVGVRPALDLARSANLKLDRGVVVDEYLQTSAADIYAAGDNAQWPDPHSGARIRVEHWVVAQRQGETAARNMLGFGERFTAVPFFWSQHYEVAINYVGHAESWDETNIDGDPASGECSIRYRRDGRTLAVATLARDRFSLEAELALESGANP